MSLRVNEEGYVKRVLLPHLQQYYTDIQHAINNSFVIVSLTDYYYVPNNPVHVMVRLQLTHDPEILQLRITKKFTCYGRNMTSEHTIDILIADPAVLNTITMEINNVVKQDKVSQEDSMSLEDSMMLTRLANILDSITCPRRA